MKSALPLPGQKVRGSRTGRPIMALLDLLGRRGTLRLIWELREGRVATFRALVEACDLPPATLNARIKELREAAIIGPEEGYRLSPLGAELLEAFGPLERWSRQWAKAMPGNLPSP